MKNLFVGKTASNFVSFIMRISILKPKSDESISNLFPLEFIKMPHNYFIEIFHAEIFQL